MPYTGTPQDGNRSNPETSAFSREEVLEGLKNEGIDVALLNAMSITDLTILSESITNLVGSPIPEKRRGRPPLDDEHIVLSPIDKKILEYFFSSSDGNLTSMMLSRKLGVPLSTIQRRRKRLEESLVEAGYTPKLDKLGWREATLAISVAGVNIPELGRDILEMNEMVLSAIRTVGESRVDLVLHVIFKTNSDLISIIEQIKQRDGVKNVSWNESVELIGKNKKGYIKALDYLP